MGRCKSVGCPKWSQGAGGMCIEHGGANPRCKSPGCPKQTITGVHCVEHGGIAARCKHSGCPKQARSGGYCIEHGGTTPRCKSPGCKRQPKGVGGHCVEHGGSKTRCKHPGCPKHPTGVGGHCIEHGGSKPRCLTPGCPKQTITSGHCVEHGGIAPRCNHTGCPKQARSGGHCTVHKPGYVPGSISRGEDAIRSFLDNIETSFNEQVSFADCVGTHSKRLRYDFSIVKDKRIIGLVEFNGTQHYMPVTFGGISWKRAVVNYEQQRVHDYIKGLYARVEGLPLLVIRYDQIKFVPEMLVNFLATIG